MVAITVPDTAGNRANSSPVGLGAPVENPVRTGFPGTQVSDPAASFDGRNADAQRQELSGADAAEVYRFVARRVANRTDAADIAQQTLLVACAKRDTCRENFSAWLLAIARHLIVDYYRTKNRFQFVEAAALMETESALQTPLDSMAVYECRERLREWVDCITHRLRLEEQVAVLLADVYDHSDKDSAAELRMTVPSFKLLLHGARTRLQKIVIGNRTLMPKTLAAPRRESENGHKGKSAKLGTGRPPFGQPAYRTGVTCRLGVPELRVLRDKLLIGLSL